MYISSLEVPACSSGWGVHTAETSESQREETAADSNGDANQKQTCMQG